MQGFSFAGDPSEEGAALREPLNKGKGGGGCLFLVTGASMKKGGGMETLADLFRALTETAPLPRAILLLSDGVRLAARGSPALEDLRLLEKNSVRVLVHGGSVERRSLDGDLEVGERVSMYTLLQEVLSAEKVVSF